MTYSPVCRDRKNILPTSGAQTHLPPAWCIKSTAMFIMYYQYCAALNLIQHQRTSYLLKHNSQSSLMGWQLLLPWCHLINSLH